MGDQHILPDWKVYDLADIDNDSVWYDGYDFPDTNFAGIDVKAVKSRDIGQVLGDKYKQNVEAGIEHTSVHQELTPLLKDYCLSDVTDLIDLYTALGGHRLDDTTAGLPPTSPGCIVALQRILIGGHRSHIGRINAVGRVKPSAARGLLDEVVKDLLTDVFEVGKEAIDRGRSNP